MYSSKTEDLDQQTKKLTLYENDIPLTYQQTITKWTSDQSFRQFWIEQLQACPYNGYTWETPSITTSTVDRQFECVFVYNSLFEGLSSNLEPFSEHFSKDDSNLVVDFPNRGATAHLVVPCPVNDASHYTHIACFNKYAVLEQQQALWQRVGEIATKRLSKKQMWISTAGLGVHWLHVRFDKRPKYYYHEAYC